MVNNTYTDDMPVVGKVEKPKKWLFEDKDLQIADKFTFGSIIGQITNNVTAIRSLMADYSEDSKEYQILINRMRMGCKLQSLQIDKAKIGRAVKGIPSVWNKWNKITDNDTDEEKAEKELFNSILCDKHPYFFIHLYKTTKQKYKKWKNEYETVCKTMWGMSVNELINLDKKDEKQIEFLNRYKRNCPVIDNSSAMNLLCHYMEDMNKGIKVDIKNYDIKSFIDIYKSKIDFDIDNDMYNNVHSEILNLRKDLKNAMSNDIEKNQYNIDNASGIGNIYNYYRDRLLDVCEDNYNIMLNCLIDIFYIDYPSYNKDILWNLFGNEIFNNVVTNSNNLIDYPELDYDGDILYLGKRYSVKKFSIKGGEYID